MKSKYKNYISLLQSTLENGPVESIEALAEAMLDAWKTKKTVYICGNVPANE